MIYVILYILLLLLSITPFFTSKFQKREIYLLNIFAIVLFLISGFRDYIGPDYGAYIHIFEESSKVIEFDDLDKIHGEYLFLFINIFLSKLGLDYRAMFLLYSFGTLILLRKVIKMNIKKYHLYSLYLYVSFYFLRETMGLIRYSLASLICIYSLKYIKNKKLFKYVMIIVLASTIQSASIIFLPAYWLYNMKISKKVWLISLGLSFVFYKINGFILLYNSINFIIPDYINKKIYITTNFSKFGQSSGFSIYQIYLIVSFLWLNFIKKARDMEGEIKLYLFGVILYFSFLNISIYAARFSDIYMKVLIIIFPNLLIQTQNKKLKLILLFVITIITLYLYSSQLIKNIDLYIPYKTWIV